MHHVRTIYIYIYHIIRCLQTKMLMISFLALIFFSFRQIGQNTRDPNSLFPLERWRRTGAAWCPKFSGSGCPKRRPNGRLVQEEKLRHLGSDAVKTGCSCLDGFENSREAMLFFLSAGFQGWSSSSPIFFTPFFFRGEHQTCLERTLQSWCILYFQAG